MEARESKESAARYHGVHMGALGLQSKVADLEARCAELEAALRAEVAKRAALAAEGGRCEALTKLVRGYLATAIEDGPRMRELDDRARALLSKGGRA